MKVNYNTTHSPPYTKLPANPKINSFKISGNSYTWKRYAKKYHRRVILTFIFVYLKTKSISFLLDISILNILQE